MQSKINILGVPVGKYNMTTLLEHFDELITSDGCKVAYAVNTHSMNITYNDTGHLEALRHADSVYVDGASILLAAKILGDHLEERLTTTDLWHPLARRSIEKGYSFYVLGGPEGLTDELIEMTENEYPELKIAGHHHGYFDINDQSIIEKINAVKPDIVWVGMGDPRQSQWCEIHKSKLNAGLLITCGGMYKVLTGKIVRAPEAWRNAGLEWLYRWGQEPFYLFKRYAIGLPLFGLRVLAQKFFGHRSKIES